MKITISAKAASLRFQGCDPTYIRETCHGRCCWTTGKDGRPTTLIHVDFDQIIPLRGMGAEFMANHATLIPGTDGTCRFQAPDGLCSVHGVTTLTGVPVKPRSCTISPWRLTKTGRLIIRNRYKLLRCYQAPPAVPAYRAFFSGLVMLLGFEQAAQCRDHFDRSGDDFVATVGADRADTLRTVSDLWGESVDTTPIERVGDVLLKRDDLAANGYGAKARAIAAIIRTEKPRRLITYGARHSCQTVVAARLCSEAGIECVLHVPDGAETVEITEASEYGAEIVRHRPGYSSVVEKRARVDFLSSDREMPTTFIKSGVANRIAVDLIAEQVIGIPRYTRRIVVAGGSGTTAAGIYRALVLSKSPIELVIVEVGGSVGNAIETLAGIDGPLPSTVGCRIVKHETPYNRPVERRIGSVELDPYYEAKAFDFVRPGDLFWIAGNRKRQERTA